MTEPGGADQQRRWWPVGLAVGLTALAVAEVLAVIVGVVVTGMSFALARDSFLISNTTIGATSALCGGLLAVNRPRHPLGWLLLAVAIAQTATAAVTPWLAAALLHGAPATVPATLYAAGWPWAVALFLPLTLLVFPSGRLPARIGGPLLGVVAANAVLQVLAFSTDAYQLVSVAGFGPGEVEPASSVLAVPALAGSWILNLSNAVLAATYLIGVVALVVRYRRGDDPIRRQVLWPLLAGVVTVVTIATTRLLAALADPGTPGFPVIATLAVALLPVGITIAILRHQLLDIRLLWSRALTYLALTAALVVTYVLVVELVSGLIGAASPVVATAVVAVAFDPVRRRLQRVVDRLLYGERDPVRAFSTVAERLEGLERPGDVLPALAETLRLPWAALVVDGAAVAETGVRPAWTETFPMRHGGEAVGELRVGVRSGQARLSASDRSVLALTALPIGVALRAETLAAAVQRSRQEIVAAREEARRRIRRDLHDGLASVLTGVAFQADAVITLADDARIVELAEDIRAGVTGTLAEVRRIINELHPTALHELGLVEAVRRHAQRLSGADLTVDLAPHALGELPAAVEVAAYRILTEALTNVARHAAATRADVEIRRGESELVVGVCDDGTAAHGAWTPGVGLESMRERAAELGGSVSAAPSATGGRVHARLPL